MYKIVIFFVILFMLYYINDYFDGWLLSAFTSMPKMIALTVGILALMFPRDYEKVPDIIEHTYSKFSTLNSKNNKNNKNSRKKGGNKRNLGESVKKLVASRQKWKCYECFQVLDASYEIDHKIPLYRGGGNHIGNLQALCRNCHGRKTLLDNIMK